MAAVELIDEQIDRTHGQQPVPQQRNGFRIGAAAADQRAVQLTEEQQRQRQAGDDSDDRPEPGLPGQGAHTGCRSTVSTRHTGSGPVAPVMVPASESG